jgi:hypothetical protein
VELDDHAVISPRHDERHVRSPWATLVGRNDNAEAAFGRKLQRVLVLEMKLRSKNMHSRDPGELKSG